VISAGQAHIVLIGMKRASPPSPPRATRGRPRTFDADAALEKAMHVFWKQGYEGSSLDDLTAAMGINRPSLYAAFGNKEALFERAVDRYMEKYKAVTADVAAAPTAREAIRRLLDHAVSAASKGKVRGCMLVQGALACGQASESIRRELIARRAANEAALRQRLERAEAEGEKLPAPPADLARYISAVLQGMAVQSSSGATAEQLRGVVNVALAGWPDATNR
jgi:AcrR family transcriptional regulator